MPRSALVRTLSGLGRRLTGKPRQGVDVDLPCSRLGTEYGGYAVLDGAVSQDSIVYSFGLGEDISFDLALMARASCQVFGFDPTPRSIAWVRSQALPAGFHLRELGIAGYDGTASFTPPKDPTHVSHSMAGPSAGASEASDTRNVSDATVTFEVRRLSTLMAELGHARVDLLKMDVEGAEYEVLEDLLRGSVRPQQILVEYHHGMHGIPVSKTENSLSALLAAGYRIFDAQPGGHEFSLCRAA